MEGESGWWSWPSGSYETSCRPDVSTVGSLAPLQGRGGCPVSCPLTPKQASRWRGAEESAGKGDPPTHTPISLPLAQLRPAPAAPPPPFSPPPSAAPQLLSGRGAGGMGRSWVPLLCWYSALPVAQSGVQLTSISS